MPPKSRLERFINAMGGEENLPPKLPKPEPNPETSEAGDSSKLQNVDDFLIQSAAAKKSEPPTTPQPKARPIPQIPHHPMHAQQDNPDVDLSFDPRMGESAPLGIKLVPFLAVKSFCYRFVAKQFEQPLATAFFDAGKIFNREWDLYFEYSSLCHEPKATIFVPESQLLVLFDEINTAFPQANVQVTNELRANGLVIEFGDKLRPLWLGHSTCRAQYDTWTADAPFQEAASTEPDKASLTVYQTKIALAVEIGKAKKKGSRPKGGSGHEAAITRRGEMSKQVGRAQCYLGLLPNPDSDLATAVAGLSLSTTKATSPPQYPNDKDGIVIAIDVEAWEDSPNTITEVGIATLDTRDLRDDAPEEDGTGWHKHIRARHFRIDEHRHITNHKHVHGCPDKFDFGKSEFVSLQHIASAITSCFHEPFSKPGVEPTGTEEKRNLILLGHDIMNDIDYLKKVGFSATNRGNLLEVLDTAIMFKSYSQSTDTARLGAIMAHFDLIPWHAHNAGNDAVYTVMAMLGLCVKSATERGNGSTGESHDQELARKTQEAVQDAKGSVDAQAGAGVMAKQGGSARTVIFGPERPPVVEEARTGLYTSGGVPLDV